MGASASNLKKWGVENESGAVLSHVPRWPHHEHAYVCLDAGESDGGKGVAKPGRASVYMSVESTDSSGSVLDTPGSQRSSSPDFSLGTGSDNRQSASNLTLRSNYAIAGKLEGDPIFVADTTLDDSPPGVLVPLLAGTGVSPRSPRPKGAKPPRSTSRPQNGPSDRNMIITTHSLNDDLKTLQDTGYEHMTPLDVEKDTERQCPNRFKGELKPKTKSEGRVGLLSIQDRPKTPYYPRYPGEAASKPELIKVATSEPPKLVKSEPTKPAKSMYADDKKEPSTKSKPQVKVNLRPFGADSSLVPRKPLGGLKALSAEKASEKEGGLIQALRSDRLGKPSDWVDAQSRVNRREMEIVQELKQDGVIHLQDHVMPPERMPSPEEVPIPSVKEALINRTDKRSQKKVWLPGMAKFKKKETPSPEKEVEKKQGKDVTRWNILPGKSTTPAKATNSTIGKVTIITKESTTSNPPQRRQAPKDPIDELEAVFESIDEKVEHLKIEQEQWKLRQRDDIDELMETIDQDVGKSDKDYLSPGRIRCLQQKRLTRKMAIRARQGQNKVTDEVDMGENLVMNLDII